MSTTVASFLSMSVLYFASSSVKRCPSRWRTSACTLTSRSTWADVSSLRRRRRVGGLDSDAALDFRHAVQLAKLREHRRRLAVGVVADAGERDAEQHQHDAAANRELFHGAEVYQQLSASRPDADQVAAGMVGPSAFGPECDRSCRAIACTTPGSSPPSPSSSCSSPPAIRATPGVLMVPLESRVRLEPQRRSRRRSRSTSRCSA